MSVKIRTQDGVEMTVNELVIVRQVVNKCKIDGNVYVCRFTSEILIKTINYIEFHARNNVSPSDVEAFHREFLNEEAKVIFRIFEAAHFFNINYLKDLTRPIVKSLIASFKPPEETTEETRSSRKKNKGKRSRIDSHTNTSFECVDGIDCIVRKDDDIVEYIPYKGVYMNYCQFVAAAGEIPDEMKEGVKRRYRCAVTFSFPSVGVKIGKTACGKQIVLNSSLESDKQAKKYFDEAFQKAVDSLSLEDLISSSSSSVLRPCASGTSSSQPMIGAVELPSLGSSSSALRPCESGTSSSRPMIEVCMDPYMTPTPNNTYVVISNKIRNAVESRHSKRRR